MKLKNILKILLRQLNNNRCIILFLSIALTVISFYEIIVEFTTNSLYGYLMLLGMIGLVVSSIIFYKKRVDM